MKKSLRHYEQASSRAIDVFHKNLKRFKWDWNHGLNYDEYLRHIEIERKEYEETLKELEIEL